MWVGVYNEWWIQMLYISFGEKEQNEEGWSERKMVTKRKAETKERKKVLKTKLWKMVTGMKKENK